MTSTQLHGDVMASLQSHAVVEPGQVPAWHSPAKHAWPPSQATPHAPQLSPSVLSSTQPLPHGTSPGRHVQTPASQSWPLPQPDLQMPLPAST
jgi:hypothetical protein